MSVADVDDDWCLGGGREVCVRVWGGIVRVRVSVYVCYYNTLHNLTVLYERLCQVPTHLPPSRTLRALWRTSEDEVIVVSRTLVSEAVRLCFRILL